MSHPRCCPTYHPGIFSNIINVTHFSTSSTFAHRPLYPNWRTTTSPMLARHQRNYTIHAIRPYTQAHQLQYPHQYKQHTNPVKLLKLLTFKFQEEIQQFLLLVVIYTAFTFQAFLSIFMGVWKTATEKLNFFRGKYSAFFRRRLVFQKQMRIFFWKKSVFLILVSFWPFYLF